MLPRSTAKYRIHPALLLLSTHHKVAIPAEPREKKESHNTMAGEDKKNDATTGNPQGGRNSAVPSLSDTQGTVANVAGSTSEKKDENAGFGIDNGKDVKGSLKVHIKLDLQADIHITAKIKGDIAIGLL